MSPVLPAEIRITEYPTSVRYELPRRPMPEGLRAQVRLFRLGLPVAAVGVGPIYLAVVQGNSFLFGVGVILLVLGALMFAGSLAMQATRSSVELTPDELKLTEWLGLVPRERVRPRHRLRRLVTHYAIDKAAPEKLTDGVIEVVCDGAQPVWFACGYPYEWMVALGAELAQRCGVPHEVAPLDGSPPVKVVPFFLAPVRDADTFDVEEAPAGSRVSVTRKEDGLTVIEVPPAGWWQLSNTFLLFLAPILVLGTYLLVNFATLALGVQVSGLVELLLAVGLVGSALIMVVVHNLRRWTVLAVNHQRLGVLETGGWVPERQRIFARDQIAAVRTGPGRIGQRGKDIIELYLFFKDGNKVGLLAGRDNAELRWLATVLRQALQVPAVAREVESPKQAVDI